MAFAGIQSYCHIKPNIYVQSQKYTFVYSFCLSCLLQNKRDQHMLKRRNVPTQDSTDSDDSEKTSTQSLQSIVQNAYSSEPTVQLSAVQAAR